ncbi:MAG: 50S ribosomal protein L21e [Candidatus Micrarchaeota archaeon]|nr:50S ribosomal protein L21e [Candidatus Micrarchaeota archaeon]
MVKRSRGTLSTYTRSLKSQGKLGVTKIFKVFKEGDKVTICLKAGHGGMPHPRYRGKHGIIVGRQGSSYIVEIQDGGMKKRLISQPVHLEMAKKE